MLPYAGTSACLWDYRGEGDDPVCIVVGNMALMPDNDGFCGGIPIPYPPVARAREESAR